jgi:hypothetical protein
MLILLLWAFFFDLTQTLKMKGKLVSGCLAKESKVDKNSIFWRSWSRYAEIGKIFEK